MEGMLDYIMNIHDDIYRMIIYSTGMCLIVVTYLYSSNNYAIWRLSVLLLVSWVLVVPVTIGSVWLWVAANGATAVPGPIKGPVEWFAGQSVHAVWSFALLGVAALGGLRAFRFLEPVPVAKRERLSSLDTKHRQLAKWLSPKNDGPVIAGTKRQRLRVTAADRACIIGPPGTGKTALLVSQIRDWSESGRSFVALDTKPELSTLTAELLSDAGYRIICINPMRSLGELAEGQSYNPFVDIAPDEIDDLTAAMVPNVGDESGDTFRRGARQLVAAVAHHLAAQRGDLALVTLPDIYGYVAQYRDVRAFVDDLRESPSPVAQTHANRVALMAGSDRLLGSIFAELASSLSVFDTPSIREAFSNRDRVSLSSLCKGRTAVFLQFEEQYQAATAALLSLLVAHLLRYLIAHHENRDAVLLLLDEIGNATPVPGLVGKLNTIRSRNLPTWLYWQSVAQMHRYGRDAAQTILGACDVQGCYRLNDNATAEAMSHKLGKAEYASTTGTYRQDVMGGASAGSSVSVVEGDRFRPDELQALKDGEMVLTYRGKAGRIKPPRYFEWWPEMRRK